MRIPARRGAFAFTALGTAVWAAMAVGATGVAAQESIEIRRAVPGEAYVKVWGGSGTVRVVGWERDSLVVTGTRAPGPGQFFHRVAGDAVKLGFEVPRDQADAVDADLHVRVPSSSMLWIKVAGAAVRVEAMRGSVDVYSVSGNVYVGGSPRTVYAESMAGDVDLHLNGSDVVRAKTGAGDVSFEGDVLDLTMTSVGGSIDAVVSRVRRARLESIDGSIVYRGGVDRGGTLFAETHAGDVELHLPPRLAASLDLATVEGEIDSELRVDAVRQVEFPGTRRVVEIGEADAEVEVRTFGGTIRLRELSTGE